MALSPFENYPSTLILDASDAGVIQIFDASRLTKDISFRVLLRLFNSDSDVKQRGDAPIFEVWPRVGCAALEGMLEYTGSVLDTTRLDSVAKQEAFPWLSVPEPQSETIAA